MPDAEADRAGVYRQPRRTGAAHRARRACARHGDRGRRVRGRSREPRRARSRSRRGARRRPGARSPISMRRASCMPPSPPAAPRCIRGTASSRSGRTSSNCARSTASRSSGPRAAAMRQVGDKLSARALARSANVPMTSGSEKVANVEQALEIAAGIGYPVITKASAGGGGRGMVVARGAADLTASFDRASTAALEAFGDGTLYLERFVEKARHVEVQVMGDGEGNVTHFGERDCSAQRRYQKMIEEAPAADPAGTTSRTRLHQAAVQLLARHRLSQRGHRRVPLRRGAAGLLLHGGQRAPAGRAPGLGGDHRHRPRPPAAAARHRPRAAAATAGREDRRPCDRGAHPRRGSGSRLHAHARPHHALAAADGRGRARRFGGRRRHGRPALLRQHDRQADRARPDARRGHRPPRRRARPLRHRRHPHQHSAAALHRRAPGLTARTASTRAGSSRHVLPAFRAKQE